MLKQNLPVFKPDAPLTRPDRPGVWIEQQCSLEIVGQSLHVEASPFGDPDEPIRAIPDPWAQARTFAEALVDHDHSMHHQFVGEWRALLALLALRTESADYSIDVKPMELGDTHIFDRMLARLHPQFAITRDIALWRQPAIVMVTTGAKTQPIAMLNPASLISPGRLSRQVRIPHVHFATDGLKDPLILPAQHRLAVASLVVLHGYLENLRAQLSQLDLTEAGRQIREELQKYIDDIVADIGLPQTRVDISERAGDRLPHLYRPLLASARAEEVRNPAAMSQCRLMLKTHGGHGAFKGVILVDEAMARADPGSRETFVWGMKTLSELLNSPARLAAVRQEAAQQGWMVITANDLFSPRAVGLIKNPRIPGHNNALRRMLLPVRPLALLLDGNLPQMLDADTDRSRASVTLTVRVQREERSVPVEITRHFRDEDGADALYVPDGDWAFFNAAVWPNFRSSIWRHYYARFLFQQNSEHIRPRFALSRGIIDAALADAADGQQAVAKLAEINALRAPGEGHDWFRTTVSQSDVDHDEMQFSDRGFEAIFYTDFAEERGDAPIGCVWLDVRTVEARPRDNALVAVDFGTTNTVVCFENGEPVQAKSRVVNPITFEDSTTVESQRDIFRWQFVDFFPPSARDLPTPTVSIERRDPVRDTKVTPFRNLVYFNPLRDARADATPIMEFKNYQKHLGRCEFNLKWGGDPKTVTAANDYLSQMMLIVAAERAEQGVDPTSLKWRFSLPDGMVGRERRALEQHFSSLASRLGAFDGLHSEGMATARYVLGGEDGADVVPGSINAILDIGGGTTDITLWADERPRWNGSFLLAGQSFFTATFVQNPELLREIGLGDWSRLLMPTDEDIADPDFVPIEPQNKPHLAELLFSGPALSRALDDNWALRLAQKPGQGLRTAGLLFIGGLAYYLGLVARELVDDGVLTPEQLDTPAFALCGRGAGLFGRIHGGLARDADSDVTRALQIFSYAAKADRKPLPKLILGDRPKLEVIRGMISGFSLIESHVDAHRDPMFEHLPAGLELEFRSGERVAPDQSVHEGMPAGDIGSIHLEAFEDFLSHFGALLDLQVDLRKSSSDGAYAKIRNEVRVAVSRAIKDAQKEGREPKLHEPPFITALRVLIREVTVPESSQSRRVTIKVTG